MDPPLHLTFGVEVEFIVSFRSADYKLQSEYQNLTYCMQDSRPARSYLCRSLVRQHLIRTLEENAVPVNGSKQVGYQKWTVGDDGSIDPWASNLPPEWDGYECLGIELTSPAYLLSQFTLGEISRVVTLIASRFHTYVNHTCGLHVHVGNAKAGFPLRTLKNFCMLIAAFERQFNSLHSTDRLHSEYAKPPGKFFRGYSPWEKVLAIHAFNKTAHIEKRFNLTDNEIDQACAYNFFNLHHTPLKTVEFRQHAGSLDPKEITMWAETACNLIGVAHNSGYFQFLALIQDHMDEAKYTVVHLLEDLGLFRAAAFYARRGVFEHPRQDWECTDPLEGFLHGLDKTNHQQYYNAQYHNASHEDETSTNSKLALDNTSTEDDNSIISDDLIHPAETQHDWTRRTWASILFEGVFPFFD